MKNSIDNPVESPHSKILFLRKSLNITQKEMSGMLHIDQSLLSKYERGERKFPRKHLEHFSSFFGLEVYQFNDCDGLDILMSFGISKKGILNSTQLNSSQLSSVQIESDNY